jgi:cytochrome c oxidase subunit 1
MTTTVVHQPGGHAHPESLYGGGLWSWLTTVDCKRVGILYGVTALILGIIGGIESLLIRTQLIVPNNDFLGADTFNAMFTIHGTTMIFMFVMPMNAAFFNYMVPL